MIALNPAIVSIDVTPTPDTWEGVMCHFTGRKIDGLTAPEAWSWWRRLCWQDRAEDALSFDREGAKVALTAVVTQAAICRLREILG